MIKHITIFAGIALCAISIPKLHGQLPAQSPAEPPTGALEVIATNGAGHEKHISSIDGVVSMIMVRLHQTVPVTLQFPADKAGMQVIALPLDGGKIGGGDLVVRPTGSTIFTFSPGAVPGRYRVELHAGANRHLLEFYVVDPSHPPR